MTEEKPPSIDADRMQRLGGYGITQKIATRTRQRELYAKTTLRYKWRHAQDTHSTFSLVGQTAISPFGNKKIVLALTILIVVLGGAILSSGPLLHSYISGGGPDPQTNIWIATVEGNGGLAPTNFQSTNTLVAVSGPTKMLSLRSNSTFAAVALSISSFDLSVIAAKELLVQMRFQISLTGTLANLETAWYLTRNSTLPLTPGYNPFFDSSVALIFDENGGGQSGELSLQRSLTSSISTDRSCGGAGNCYINCGSTLTLGDTNDYAAINALNFTGSTGAGGANGQSSVSMGSAPTTCSSTTLPWFAFQGQPYYLGFWSQAGVTTPFANWMDSGGNNPSMAFVYYVPTITVINPQIDTGGFFGPVIKALISIGVFILSAIFSFLGYVWQALQSGLNILGNFLGLGNIGTAIANAFQGFVTWISAVLGTVFSNVANVATTIGNELTAIGNVTGNYFSNLGNALSVLSNLSSQFWGVMTTLKLVGTVSASFFLAAWMLWGAVLAFQDIDKFWTQWYRTTGFAILWVFKVLWWSGEAGYGVMLKIKSLIWPTSSGGGIVPQPGGVG